MWPCYGICFNNGSRRLVNGLLFLFNFLFFHNVFQFAATPMVEAGDMALLFGLASIHG